MSRAFLFLILLLPLQQNADFYRRFADAAVSLTKQNVEYDGSYFKIEYPLGDVPPNKGVCTDVVIRAYRKVGIDLQKEVHQDMAAHFSLYPKTWSLKGTDTNRPPPRAQPPGILYPKGNLITGNRKCS